MKCSKHDDFKYLSLLQGDTFPEHVADMSSLRWLRINKTGMEMLPDELSQLNKLVSKAIKIIYKFKFSIEIGDLISA